MCLTLAPKLWLGLLAPPAVPFRVLSPSRCGLALFPHCDGLELDVTPLAVAPDDRVARRKALLGREERTVLDAWSTAVPLA